VLGVPVFFFFFAPLVYGENRWAVPAWGKKIRRPRGNFFLPRQRRRQSDQPSDEGRTSPMKIPQGGARPSFRRTRGAPQMFARNRRQRAAPGSPPRSLETEMKNREKRGRDGGGRKAPESTAVVSRSRPIIPNRPVPGPGLKKPEKGKIRSAPGITGVWPESPFFSLRPPAPGTGPPPPPPPLVTSPPFGESPVCCARVCAVVPLLQWPEKNKQCFFVCFSTFFCFFFFLLCLCCQAPAQKTAV